MLVEAYRDLKYLLNRGYRKGSAIEFVANHYRLRKTERHILVRCVFSDSWIDEVEKKLLGPGDLKGKTLAVDGFNVLITLESILDGKAFLCEDGLVRDLKYLGKYRVNERTPELLTNIAEALKGLGLGKVYFFYGKNVPKSGIIKEMTESAIIKFDVPGEVKLVKSPDFELKKFEIVATADIGIIAKTRGVFDLAAYVGRIHGKSPLPFEEVLRRWGSRVNGELNI